MKLSDHLRKAGRRRRGRHACAGARAVERQRLRRRDTTPIRRRPVGRAQGARARRARAAPRRPPVRRVADARAARQLRRRGARARCSRTSRSRSSAAERDALVAQLGDEVLGYGPIERFLADPTVTEVMVNAGNPIYIERGGRLYKTDARFASEARLRLVIERIVSAIGRRIDESSPMVDARLADGSRVNAIIPPLAIDGPALTIRKFAKTRLTLDDLISFGTLAPDAAEFLAACVARPPEHRHQRRYRHRQDDAAQRAVVADRQRRAHRHHRGRGRAPARPGAPHPAGVAAREPRRPGRGRDPRPRAQRPAHAARPHHRR